VRTIHAADLFCGAGGTSTGLARACTELSLGLDLLAINHWDVAIQTHSRNHPTARHLCADLDTISPRVASRGRLSLLIASPECTHHSRARGGRPVNDQLRASAWHVLRWAEAVRIDSILIENVREFREWGPIGSNGRPLKSRKGETYKAFLSALGSLGYRVEDRVLNAADYGDPTTRERLFIQARRGRGPIRWPEPTHSRDPELFRGERWRPARSVIDWSIRGSSIFRRKRPLRPATILRIAEGIRRFGGPAAEPFLVVLRGTGGSRSLDLPIPALTAGGKHLGIVEPFILQQQSGGAPRSVSQPLPTVAAKGAIGLVQPFLMHVTHGGRAHSVEAPIPTVTCAARGELGLVEPFLVPFFGEREGQRPRVHSIDQPMPTIASGSNCGLVEPFLASYNGGSTCLSPVSDPVPTVTTRDRFGLVEPRGEGPALDILFRMLQPHELARAMSFDDDYAFEGNRGDRVRQIGNAVPVRLATALCRTILEDAA